MNQSNELGELNTALAVAQGQLRDPKKNTKGYNYKYADLPSTLEAIRPIFAELGLSFTQMLSGGQDGFIEVTTRVMHNSGQFLESTFAMPIEIKKGMSSAQCIGSTITYMKRYAIQAAVGICADEDTDHNDVRPDRDSKPKTQRPKNNGVIEISLADELIKALENAKSEDDLNAVAKRAQEIDNDADKNRVREVYGVRKKELDQPIH